VFRRTILGVLYSSYGEANTKDIHAGTPFAFSTRARGSGRGYHLAWPVDKGRLGSDTVGKAKP
jgi:hypothetical protein